MTEAPGRPAPPPPPAVDLEGVIFDAVNGGGPGPAPVINNPNQDPNAAGVALPVDAAQAERDRRQALWDAYGNNRAHENEYHRRLAERIKKRAAERTEAANRAKKARLSGYTFAWNFLYELFTVVIGVSDIVSDVLVTYQFWFISKTFFGLSLTVMILAQLFYAYLFFLMFSITADNTRACGHLLHILFGLCFGQLVPLIIWFNQFHFGWWDAFMKACGLEPGNFDRENDREAQRTALKDPFKQYLEAKLRAHGGFLIESFVEGIPQSIIQLVAITMLGQYSYINVFSLTMSLLSISSKALMGSYALSKKVVAFNFFCIMHDVMCLFCTICWLFLPAPSPSLAYPIFFVPAPNAILTAIWLYKEFIAICLIIFTILIGFLAVAAHAKSRGRLGGELCGGACMAFCYILWMPVGYLLLQNFKFAFIPLIFTAERQTGGDVHSMLKPMHDWIRRKDSDLRLCIANTFTYAYQVAANCHDPDFAFVLREPHLYSHARIRRVKGYDMKSLGSSFLSMTKPGSDETCMVAMLYGIVQFFVLPCFIIVLAYSVAYPVASFIYYLSLGYPVPLLHMVISSVHCAVVFFLIAFAKPTISYKLLRLHSVTLVADLKNLEYDEVEWMRAMEKKYEEVKRSGVDDLPQWALHYHLSKRLETSRTPAWFYRGEGHLYVDQPDPEWWRIAGLEIPADALRPDAVFITDPQDPRRYYLPNNNGGLGYHGGRDNGNTPCMEFHEHDPFGPLPARNANRRNMRMQRGGVRNGDDAGEVAPPGAGAGAGVVDGGDGGGAGAAVESQPMGAAPARKVPKDASSTTHAAASAQPNHVSSSGPRTSLRVSTEPGPSSTGVVGVQISPKGPTTPKPSTPRPAPQMDPEADEKLGLMDADDGSESGSDSSKGKGPADNN